MANVQNSPKTVQTNQTSAATLSLVEMLAKQATMNAEIKRMQTEANAFAEQHAKEFAAAKSTLRTTAMEAMQEYRNVCGDVEYKSFIQATTGLGKRNTAPCSECGAKRHTTNGLALKPCSKATKIAA